MNEKSPKLAEDKQETVSSSNLTLVNMNDNEDDEIDLLELFYRLLDKWHYLLLCCLAGAVLLNAFAYFMIHPTYETTAKLYIVSASKDSVVDLTDLNIGTSLTKDYEELIFSWPVLEQVIEKLDLDMDADSLRDMISIENPDDTRIINITVTSTDPKQAKDIANSLSQVCVKYLPETMNTDKPNIAQSAKYPQEKAGPSYLKFTMIGALLGLLLCCAWVVYEYLMDDTIHSAEDMERYFGIIPLTSIPENKAFVEEEIERAHKKKKNKGKFKTGSAAGGQRTKKAE